MLCGGSYFSINCILFSHYHSLLILFFSQRQKTSANTAALKRKTYYLHKITEKTMGQFYQPFGTKRKCTSTEHLAQKMLFSFTNRIAPNSTCAHLEDEPNFFALRKGQCSSTGTKAAHKMMVKLTPSYRKTSSKKT